jgi:Tol biopolymer transport system component
VSPDGKWMLTDEYPNAESNRPLILYNIAEGQRVDIDNLYSPPELAGELRCDLHPRWNRAGDKVCVDSAHTSERQMYVYDVSSIVRQK